MVQEGAAEGENQGGLLIENVRSRLRPGPGREGADDPNARPSGGPGFEQPQATSETFPLDPRIVKFSIGAMGDAAAELTRYPGWRFKEEELEAFADALAQIGIHLPMWANLLVVCASILGGKAMAYALWVRAGKPPLTESTRRLLESEPAGNEQPIPEPMQ